MAESVHFYLEQMLPELQDLQRKGLFSPAEVKLIVKKRTEFEYALKKRINKKVDYLRYIEYEMNLETLRKKRRARAPSSKTGPSDFAGPKRIHFIFKRALKKFPGDINLWVQYIQYAQRIKSYKSLGQIFARALQLHPHNHKLWILAADYENTTNANTSGARVLLQRALRLNPESTDLWLSYFTLEMNWVDKVRERRRVLLGEKDDHLKLYGSESDDQQSENDDDAALSGSDAERDEHTKPKSLSIPSLPNEPKMKNSKLKFQNVPNGDEASMSEDNPFFQYIIPRAVYKNAIKAVPNDLTFRTEFLSIYSKYEATEIAREEVYQTLMENFASDSKALSIVLSRHISSTLPTSPAFPRQLKMVVDDFVAYFDDSNLDDDLVRGLYEEFCSLLVRLLQTVQDSNLKLYVATILIRTVETVLSTEKFYPSLISYLVVNHSEITDHVASTSSNLKFPDEEAILEKAVSSYPSNPEIQLMYLTHFASAQNYEAAMRQVPLTMDGKGRVILEYLKFLLKDDAARLNYSGIKNTVDSFWKELGLLSRDDLDEHNRGLDTEFLNVWLGWVAGNFDLKEMRLAYNRLLSITLQISAPLLKSLIQIEQSSLESVVDQKTRNESLSAIRKLYERIIALSDNGHDIDSWISYIKFETSLKNFTKTQELHWKAKKNFEKYDSLLEMFEERFAALENDASS